MPVQRGINGNDRFTHRLFSNRSDLGHSKIRPDLHDGIDIVAIKTLQGLLQSGGILLSDIDRARCFETD